MKYFYLLILITFTTGISVEAQENKADTLEIVVIQTKDGSTFSGKLIESDVDKIVIESASLGQLEIQKSNIESINTQGENYNNSSTSNSKGIDIDYHNSTRYMINSSGFTLKKGQKYYENIGVFFSSFAFGITDRFTLTVGGEVASLLFGQEFPILYVAPKYSVLQSDKFNVTLGATYFDSPGSYFEGLGIVNAAFTFGDRNNNFTIGPGFGYSIDNGFETSVVPINVAFMKRMSKKLSFVSDSYFILYDSDVTGIISLAARIHFKTGAAFNAGLWKILEDTEDIFALPFVSALIPFGKK